MNVWMIVINSLWAALFATGFGVILTTPARALVSCFVCGFMGRFVRDVLMGWGLSQNWSTAVAAAAVVLVAVAIVRGHRVSPVVLICGILPLGAAVAMFNAIFELMKVTTLKGEALSVASTALSANAGKVFTGTLAIAFGLAAGWAIMRLVGREPAAGI
jgi:uncharacterized membrane protein YjjB (DUF3815 family)